MSNNDLHSLTLCLTGIFLSFHPPYSQGFFLKTKNHDPSTQQLSKNESKAKKKENSRVPHPFSLVTTFTARVDGVDR